MIRMAKFTAILAAGAVVGAAALALISADGHDGEVRIAARSLGDGRVETALQIREGGGWGERITPELRVLPAGARAGVWHAGSGIEVEAGDDGASAAGAGVPADVVGRTATAVLRGPDGSAMGTVMLEQGPRGVLIRARASGLSEGAHGFHIHETGACEPDFSAAGGHFNPAGIGHGLLHEGGHHEGDLPNIIAHADGSAMADYYTEAVTLAEGPAHSLFDGDGSAIMIHEGPDGYGEDPGAGPRAACGMITRDG